MPGAQRVIAHMDLDTFFVSVERRRDPSLNGKPVLVGGTRDRGVVASCSYEARAFGVHAGMPMRQATRLCPQAILVGHGYDDYIKASAEVRAIIAAQAPVLEFASIDECYLDLSGMDRFFGAWDFVTAIREQIMRETRLPISLGMAGTKAVAKIATGQAKPCGALHLLPGTEKAFLALLPVQKIPGAGPEACKTLRDLGIHTIGDLQQWPVDDIERALGRWGRSLWHKANASDSSEVQPVYERKQVGTEETLDSSTTDIPRMEALITRQVEQLAYHLRSKGKLSGCVAVKVRYDNFDTPSQQKTIPHTALDDKLLATALGLFRRLIQKGRPVRLLGVTLSHLVPGGVQLDLLTDTVERTALLQATDAIRSKYGSDAVHRAVTLTAVGRGRTIRTVSERGLAPEE